MNGRVTAFGMALLAVFSWCLMPLGPARAEETGKSRGHIHYKLPEEYKGKKNPYWTNLPAILEGGLIYQERCAVCHGKSGRGDGQLARFLDPKPMDFSDSRAMADVNDAYLLWRVSEGGKMAPFDSIMPRWKGVLKEDEMWKVIAYIHAFSHGEEHLKLEHRH